MNICIFNWRDIRNPVAGGAEVFTHELAKRWVKAKHNVTLFAVAFDGCVEQEMVDGVEIIRRGNKLSVYNEARRWFGQQNEKFDIVIDEINTKPFFAPRFCSVPVVALVHQLAREFWWYETSFPVNALGYYWFEKHWLRQYVNVPTMTVSNSTKQDLEQLGFNNVTIVPEGISAKPLRAVSKKAERPTLIFVGRLQRAKRPDHAIEAFRLVKQRIPDVQLWVVGDGYMLEQLKKSYNVPDVTFFGRIPQKQKLRLMQRSHALLMPAVREGWGLVVTEAAAMGTPAIGYDVHGIRDAVQNGKSGILVEPNPQALSEKAVELLQDKVLQKQLSRGALIWSKKFSWDKSAKIAMKFLEQVVKGAEK